jgi:hypothetical protein
MASTEKRIRDGQVIWLARWRDPAGRQHKRTFPRKTDAERHLTTVEHSVLTGTYVDAAAGRIAFGPYAERWLATKISLKTSTRESYASLLRSRVLPRWKAVPLSAVSHADATAWLAELTAEGVGASRVR